MTLSSAGDSLWASGGREGKGPRAVSDAGDRRGHGKEIHKENDEENDKEGARTGGRAGPDPGEGGRCACEERAGR